MARRRRAARPVRSAVACGLAIALQAGGCSYSREEPGLLGDRPAEPAATASRPATNWPRTRQRTSLRERDLPVLGEEVWTTADGLAVTVRIAVHAVRRIADGTVLDWSVTPLSAPRLNSSAVPAALDLGLTSDQRAAIALVDPAARAVYRPLRSAKGHCLCSRPGPGTDGWRIGGTRLLQAVFPPLPAALTHVDVAIATVPPFGDVPLMPEDVVPVAHSRTDLARPADLPAPYLAGPGFGYPDQRGQVLVVEPLRVLAGHSTTTLVWRIQSVRAGPGLGQATQPPLVDDDRQITGNRIAASGPVLIAAGRRLAARLVTDRAAHPDAVTCWCTDLRGWAGGLRHADQIATVVTNYPPLPPGQSEVLVEFAGQGARRIDVVRYASTVPAGPTRRHHFERWLSATGEPPRWSARDWPTPLPDPDMLDDSVSTLDAIVR